MTARRATALVPLLVLCACKSDVLIRLPFDPSSQSFIVGIETGTSFEARAVSRDGFDEIAPRGSKYTLLVYRETLSKLGLSPGPLPKPGPGEFTRMLPRFASAFDVTAEKTSSWQSLQMIGPPLADLLLPEPSPIACAMASRCYDPAIVDLGGKVFCTECPEPPVRDEPHALIATASTTLPMLGPPPASSQPALCAPGSGTAQFIDDSGCVLVGACGSDEWADVPSDAIFVRANAAMDGLGTRASPRTLADALSHATNGSTIALARGDYSGPILIDKPVTLWGACPGDASHNGSVANQITVSTAGHVTLRGMTVHGGAGEAVRVGAGSLRLADLIIIGDGRVGLRVEPEQRVREATAHATNLVVLQATIAVMVSDGGGFVGEQIVLESSSERSLVVRGATATVADAVIRNDVDGIVVRSSTLSDIPATLVLDRAVVAKTRGLTVAGASNRARINRATIDSASVNIVAGRLDLTNTSIANVGVLSVSSGANVTLGNLIVLDSSTTAAGYAVLQVDRSRIDIERASFDQNRSRGIAIGTSTATLGDVTVRGVPNCSACEVGVELVRSRAMLKNLHLEEERGVGIQVFSPSLLSIADVEILRVATDGSTTSAGLKLSNGGATVERLHVAGMSTGVAFADTHSSTISDIKIEDTTVTGIGINWSIDPPLAIEASRLVLNRAMGGMSIAGKGAHAHLSDAVFEGATIGLFISEAEVSIERIQVDQSQRLATEGSIEAITVATNAHATLTDARIIGAGPRAAVLTHDGGRIDLVRSLVSNTRGVACQVGALPDRGDLHISSSEIADSSIGASVKVGVDLNGLLDRALFRGNGVAIEVLP